jgi:hypothetical protein
MRDAAMCTPAIGAVSMVRRRSKMTSVTYGIVGCNARTMASMVCANTACCAGLFATVGLMASRYQSQKSRHAMS